MPPGMEVGLGPGDFVFDGDQAPAGRGHSPSQFLTHVLQRNSWVDQDATWCGGKSRPRRRCVRWVAAPLPLKRGTAPQFSVHVYCDQTAEWMKTPLGTEVGLGPSHIVLDGDPAPARKGHNSPPLFGPCLLWPRSPISAIAELVSIELKVVAVQNGYW